MHHSIANNHVLLFPVLWLHSQCCSTNNPVALCLLADYLPVFKCPSRQTYPNKTFIRIYCPTSRYWPDLWKSRNNKKKIRLKICFQKLVQSLVRALSRIRKHCHKWKVMLTAENCIKTSISSHELHYFVVAWFQCILLQF